MLFLILIIILLLSIAVTLRRDLTILYSRTTMVILIYCALISISGVSLIYLGKCIGLFGDLFHLTNFEFGEMEKKKSSILDILIKKTNYLNSADLLSLFSPKIKILVNYTSNLNIDKIYLEFKVFILKYNDGEALIDCVYSFLMLIFIFVKSITVNSDSTDNNTYLMTKGEPKDSDNSTVHTTTGTNNTGSSSAEINKVEQEQDKKSEFEAEDSGKDSDRVITEGKSEVVESPEETENKIEIKSVINTQDILKKDDKTNTSEQHIESESEQVPLSKNKGKAKADFNTPYTEDSSYENESPRRKRKFSEISADKQGEQEHIEEQSESEQVPLSKNKGKAKADFNTPYTEYWGHEVSSEKCKPSVISADEQDKINYAKEQWKKEQIDGDYVLAQLLAEQDSKRNNPQLDEVQRENERVRDIKRQLKLDETLVKVAENKLDSDSENVKTYSDTDSDIVDTNTVNSEDDEKTVNKKLRLQELDEKLRMEKIDHDIAVEVQQAEREAFFSDYYKPQASSSNNNNSSEPQASSSYNDRSKASSSKSNRPK